MCVCVVPNHVNSSFLCECIMLCKIILLCTMILVHVLDLSDYNFFSKMALVFKPISTFFLICFCEICVVVVVVAVCESIGKQR